MTVPNLWLLEYLSLFNARVILHVCTLEKVDIDSTDFWSHEMP